MQLWDMYITQRNSLQGNSELMAFYHPGIVTNGGYYCSLFSILVTILWLEIKGNDFIYLRYPLVVNLGQKAT